MEERKNRDHDCFMHGKWLWGSLELVHTIEEELGMLFVCSFFLLVFNKLFRSFSLFTSSSKSSGGTQLHSFSKQLCSPPIVVLVISGSLSDVTRIVATKHAWNDYSHLECLLQFDSNALTSFFKINQHNQVYCRLKDLKFQKFGQFWSTHEIVWV